MKNSLGYRDIEWTPQLLEERTKIMVLGDSFAAGWGIENKADLFSYKLGQMLGDDYAVMNVGRAGASTQGEIENALAYPYKPDVIILAFYLNDIDGVAVDKGFPPLPAARVEPDILEPLVENSYAANFFYWRIYRLGSQERSTAYWNWLQGRYIYQRQGVPVLDVTNLVEGIDSRYLVVNSVDPHPSKLVHQLVAEALYPMILDSSKKAANSP